MAQSLGYLLAAFGPMLVGNLKAASGSWFAGELTTMLVAVVFTIFGVLSERKLTSTNY